MDSFGDRLRWEREGRGLSIEAVAETIGADQERLLALERNDFDALPDETVMVACLRDYADCLDVDAELMIKDYVLERERCLRILSDDVTARSVETVALESALAEVAAVETARAEAEAFDSASVEVAAVEAATAVATTFEPAPVTTRDGNWQRLAFWLVVAAILVTVAILGTWQFEPNDGTATSTTPEAAASTPASIENSSPARTDANAGSAKRSVPATSAPAALSIPEHGVGTGVERLQLVGRNDRFAAGTQVWFWTRVEGGKSGDRIAHVWLHDGVEALRIPLKLGGSRWRTYSNKTLRAGAVGDWAVEARDDAGRVLARNEFVCR